MFVTVDFNGFVEAADGSLMYGITWGDMWRLFGATLRLLLCFVTFQLVFFGYILWSGPALPATNAFRLMLNIFSTCFLTYFIYTNCGFFFKDLVWRKIGKRMLISYQEKVNAVNMVSYCLLQCIVSSTFGINLMPWTTLVNSVSCLVVFSILYFAGQTVGLLLPFTPVIGLRIPVLLLESFCLLKQADAMTYFIHSLGKWLRVIEILCIVFTSGWILLIPDFLITLLSIGVASGVRIVCVTCIIIADDILLTGVGGGTAAAIPRRSAHA